MIIVQDVETKEILQTASRVITANEIAGRGTLEGSDDFIIQMDDLVKIYPNPGDDWVRLVLDQKVTSWELRNALGEVVLIKSNVKEILKGKILTLQTKELPVGYYIIQFGDQHNQQFSKKLVIVH